MFAKILKFWEDFANIPGYTFYPYVTNECAQYVQFNLRILLTVACQAPLVYDSPAKNIGGCHFLSLGIFQTQASKPDAFHTSPCIGRWILYTTTLGSLKCGAKISVIHAYLACVGEMKGLLKKEDSGEARNEFLLIVHVGKNGVIIESQSHFES